MILKYLVIRERFDHLLYNTSRINEIINYSRKSPVIYLHVINEPDGFPLAFNAVISKVEMEFVPVFIFGPAVVSGMRSVERVLLWTV